ncbi:MAG: monosaccharide transporter rane proteinCUT2 family [Armatimonadetes bacterium]|jgi:ribose transport system permease protein|nr:monosaccharide transporter rane proteinCUT2 family [Armatimonadota bacterium]
MPEATISKPAPAGFGKLVSRWLATPEGSVLVVIFLLLGLLGLRGSLPQFLSPFNTESLARSISLQSIFAIGELLVILTGGIDLSLGSLISFDGMLLATVMGRLADGGMPVGQATAIGILVVMLFSLGLGLLHATLIQYLKLPPFVVTLASMSILRSGALLLNNAVPIPIDRFELITFLGNRKIFLAGTGVGLPVSSVILVVVGVVMVAVLQYTRVGRRVYSVGSNEEASRLSGVNVFHVRAFVYGTCSLLGGVAAVLYAGYGAQGDPNSGVMFELNAISAAVIGGAVLTGGRGSVIGTVLGAMLLEGILSMININLSNPTLWRGMVVGGVLLTAVIFNQIRIMRMSRR